MKVLLFMRHGKSSWSNGSLPDHERPLKSRGIEDANLIGNWLGDKKDWHPEVIFSSSAARAMETAQIVKRYLPSDLELNIESSLYTFSIFQLIDEIKKMDDGRNKIMLFGHNPAYTALYNYLSDVEVDNVPTAGLCHFVLDIKSWKELDSDTVLQGRLVSPKSLRMREN